MVIVGLFAGYCTVLHDFSAWTLLTDVLHVAGISVEKDQETLDFKIKCPALSSWCRQSKDKFTCEACIYLFRGVGGEVDYVKQFLHVGRWLCFTGIHTLKKP